MSAAVPAPRVGDSQAGAAVELAGVGKTFRGGTDVTALDDVDLTIGIGEFVTFIGPSGCGKSTLLRLIADLTEPSSGTVSVNGKTARQARLDQDYGIAFQLAGLMDWLMTRGTWSCRWSCAAGIGRGGVPAPASCSSWSGYRTSRTPGRSSCPAACSSGSRSPAHLRPDRSYCSWTSRSARWTR